MSRRLLASTLQGITLVREGMAQRGDETAAIAKHDARGVAILPSAGLDTIIGRETCLRGLDLLR